MVQVVARRPTWKRVEDDFRSLLSGYREFSVHVDAAHIWVSGSPHNLRAILWALADLQIEVETVIYPPSVG